jgi:hypothetical protein
MNNIIYLHGFGSSGESNKGKLLKSVYHDRVLTPDLLCKPEEDIKKIKNLIENSKNPILVGSSYGGLYADYFNKIFELKALYINPLTDVTKLKNFIGDHKYYNSNREFTFSKKDYDYLLFMYEEIERSITSNSTRIVLLAKDDSVIDYKVAENYFVGENDRLIISETGGHNFSCDDLLLDTVRVLLN